MNSAALHGKVKKLNMIMQVLICDCGIFIMVRFIATLSLILSSTIKEYFMVNGKNAPLLQLRQRLTG